MGQKMLMGLVGWRGIKLPGLQGCESIPWGQEESWEGRRWGPSMRIPTIQQFWKKLFLMDEDCSFLSSSDFKRWEGCFASLWTRYCVIPVINWNINGGWHVLWSQVAFCFTFLGSSRTFFFFTQLVRCVLSYGGPKINLNSKTLLYTWPYLLQGDTEHNY